MSRVQARHRAEVEGLWGQRLRVTCRDCLLYEVHDNEGTAHREAQRHELTAPTHPGDDAQVIESARTPDLCPDCNIGEHLLCDDRGRRAAGLCGCTSSRHEQAAPARVSSADGEAER